MQSTGHATVRSANMPALLTKRSSWTERRQLAHARFELYFAKSNKWIEMFDMDGSKTLDKEELRIMMLEIGKMQPTDEELEQVLLQSDLNGSGDIDLMEVKLSVAAWSAMRQEKAYIEELFTK